MYVYRLNLLDTQLILDELIYFHDVKIKATIHASANSI